MSLLLRTQEQGLPLLDLLFGGGEDLVPQGLEVHLVQSVEEPQVRVHEEAVGIIAGQILQCDSRLLIHYVQVLFEELLFLLGLALMDVVGIEETGGFFV